MSLEEYVKQIGIFLLYNINLLWSDDIIWYYRTWSPSVHVMASHLFDTKPLPEPMLSYC